MPRRDTQAQWRVERSDRIDAEESRERHGFESHTFTASVHPNPGLVGNEDRSSTKGGLVSRRYPDVFWMAAVDCARAAIPIWPLR